MASLEAMWSKLGTVQAAVEAAQQHLHQIMAMVAEVEESTSLIVLRTYKPRLVEPETPATGDGKSQETAVMATMAGRATSSWQDLRQDEDESPRGSP